MKQAEQKCSAFNFFVKESGLCIKLLVASKNRDYHAHKIPIALGPNIIPREGPTS